MSWLFSRVLVEEYLEANCLDGEPYAQLSVMPTQHKFWRNDKMMDFLRLSQFGLTCAVLTEQDGEALLTSYLEDFHAKTLAQQEKVQESKAQEVECGKRWHGLLAKLDLDTLSWKTAQCSLLEDLEQSLQTWPRWGSMRNGECYQQPMLAQITKEKESGCLPDNETFFHTPNTTGMDGGSNSRKALKKRLMWPTPTCHNNNEKGSPSEFLRDSPGLGTVVLWFPTPQASDNRDMGNMSNPSIQRRVKMGRQIMLSQSVDLSSGLLNPNWVEWLMGWHIGWTDLKPLAMDKFHYAPQQHLNCLESDLTYVEKDRQLLHD